MPATGSFIARKGNVETPTYHYDKNPDVIYTILGQCWRLHYLRCTDVSLRLFGISVICILLYVA